VRWLHFELTAQTTTETEVAWMHQLPREHFQNFGLTDADRLEMLMECKKVAIVMPRNDLISYISGYQYGHILSKATTPMQEFTISKRFMTLWQRFLAYNQAAGLDYFHQKMYKLLQRIIETGTYQLWYKWFETTVSARIETLKTQETVARFLRLPRTLELTGGILTIFMISAIFISIALMSFCFELTTKRKARKKPKIPTQNILLVVSSSTTKVMTK